MCPSLWDTNSESKTNKTETPDVADRVFRSLRRVKSGTNLFNYLENPFTVVDGEATAINPLLTEVFEFQLEGDGNNLAESLVSERQNGTSVNTQTFLYFGLQNL